MERSCKNLLTYHRDLLPQTSDPFTHIKLPLNISYTLGDCNITPVLGIPVSIRNRITQYVVKGLGNQDCRLMFGGGGGDILHTVERSL